MPKYSKMKRKVRLRPRARKAVDRRQDRNISKLYRMVKYGKERKFVDQVPLTTTVSNGYVNILTRDLTYIPEGSTDNTRIGTKCKLFSHQIRVIVTCGDATQLYRILVVRFGQCPTASLGIQHVLEDAASANPYQLLSNKKRNGSVQYQILYDSKIRKLAQTAGNLNMKQRVHNINLRNKNGWFCQYENANANSCINGFTYVVMCSDSALAPHVGVQTLARTTFEG